MKIATSRVTQQGQISIPAEIRRRLGLVPGSTLEWEADGDTIVVRKAGKYSAKDIHDALFGGAKPPAPVSVEDMDEAIASYLADKHARH